MFRFRNAIINVVNFFMNNNFFVSTLTRARPLDIVKNFDHSYIRIAKTLFPMIPIIIKSRSGNFLAGIDPFNYNNLVIQVLAKLGGSASDILELNVVISNEVIQIKDDTDLLLISKCQLPLPLIISVRVHRESLPESTTNQSVVSEETVDEETVTEINATAVSRARTLYTDPELKSLKRFKKYLSCVCEKPKTFKPTIHDLYTFLETKGKDFSDLFGDRNPSAVLSKYMKDFRY